MFAQDEERTQVSEVREKYRRRKDKLRMRILNPQKDSTQEFFDAGLPSCLKDVLLLKGERRDMSFYSAARLDGLVLRAEQIGVKMIETFAGRDDHLVYRSVTYLPPVEQPPEAERKCAPVTTLVSAPCLLGFWVSVFLLARIF